MSKRISTRHRYAAEAKAFVTLAIEVFGARYWRQDIRDGLGYHYATIMRYQSGEIEPPAVLMTVLRVLAATPRRVWEPIIFKNGRERTARGRPKSARAESPSAG